MIKILIMIQYSLIMKMIIDYSYIIYGITNHTKINVRVKVFIQDRII